MATTSGTAVFPPDSLFGLRSERHPSRDTGVPSSSSSSSSSGLSSPTPDQRPPSLGSEGLNQALSHPVNLKQSGFNSSCLSAAGAQNTASEGGVSEAGDHPGDTLTQCFCSPALFITPQAFSLCVYFVSSLRRRCE